MFYDLENKKPKNSGENWVAPNAVIIGDVTLDKNSSIWFNTTLRGCLLYTSPSPRDPKTSRMPSSA